MNTAITTSTHIPDSFYDESARLGAEISEICSYIHAATYRLLVLIREFDEKSYWGLPGLCSCAHWLNLYCGIGMNAAREKVRVAHALKNLPQISEALRRGELSYSKVRAMTRIADESNEDYLMMIARYGTAHHVEKLVSKYSRCNRQQDLDNANKQHANRKLSCSFDEDGSFVIEGRMPPEQGALIMKALELAMDRAGTSLAKIDLAADVSEREPFHRRRADALREIAETYLNNEPGDASTADRYQVVVHVTAETLESIQTADTDSCAAGVCAAVNAIPDAPPILACLDDGPRVTAETSRRIACDASIVKLIEDKDGEPLSIGRKSRVIPPGMRRALRARDHGCRFPGCTNHLYIDSHHIEHWANGGETSLGNLVQLCRHHHRLVHEGGFVCDRDELGKVTFRNQRQQALGTCVLPTPLADDDTLEDWMVSQMHDFEIDGSTGILNCMAGDRMDWNLAVEHLFLCKLH